MLTEKELMQVPFIQISKILMDWQLRKTNKKSWEDFGFDDLNGWVDIIFEETNEGWQLDMRLFDRIADLHFLLSEMVVPFYEFNNPNDTQEEKAIEFCITQLRTSKRTLDELLSELSKLLFDEYNVFKAIVSIGSFNSEEVKQSNFALDTLTLKQIALIHHYEGWKVTRESAKEIAEKYGYISGDKLYQESTFFNRKANRTGLPNPDTAPKRNNKIELFESVLPHLTDKAKKRALDEIKSMKVIFSNEP